MHLVALKEGNSNEQLARIHLVLDALAHLNDEDNRDKIERVTRKLAHMIHHIKDAVTCKTVTDEEYSNALVVISCLIDNIQSISRRQLQRLLGDCTWNSTELAGELHSLSECLNLSITQDTTYKFNRDAVRPAQSVPSDTSPLRVEDAMVKLAELDISMNSPSDSDPWPKRIMSKAHENTSTRIAKRSRHTAQDEVTNTPIRSNIQIDSFSKAACRSVTTAIFPDLKMNSSLSDVTEAIRNAGYRVPNNLTESQILKITVSDGPSVYDASVEGGLKISRSEPLLWWWNKYLSYHNLAPPSTPGQTTAHLEDDGGVHVGGVTLHFHRTLRVPDTGVNPLPMNLGIFPLIPVEQYAHRIPESIRTRGGFILPVFRREALWVRFSGSNAAVKLAVGGINAISGVCQDDSPEPSVEQDYIVAGLQPWMDGIVTRHGVVRQFVASEMGNGYTVEEQINGKGDMGGFQFDIFPERQVISGKFRAMDTKHDGQWSGDLDHYKSAAELELNTGDTLHFIRNPIDISLHVTPLSSVNGERHSMRKHLNSYITTKQKWTISSYQRRVSPSAILQAKYLHSNSESRRVRSYRGGRRIAVDDSVKMGLAAGGEILQKIYKDPKSPRVYNEHQPRRIYFHLVSPEAWEVITHVLPPITPITQDMYLKRGIPWFNLFDDYVSAITKQPGSLSQVKSITTLDQEGRNQSRTSTLINPNNPPRCNCHPNAVISAVYRPCGHGACNTCLGTSLLGGSVCSICKSSVSKFVGVTSPIPMISSVSPLKGANSDKLGWDVEEVERFSALALDRKDVICIHLQRDKVSALHSNSWWMRQ
ncbi:hypothetical protein BDQ12DRAFT_739804 [Crucibulum laeve]|uniref:RING-type domain-containing protein n=1 Tax=Crucibulum laeve TaxID=68775 RepID=A0A5C3LF82_9AGAR|nr:hypothetical protein BDQ12DRAFT_739804 [Crucibulum laeve]